MKHFYLKNIVFSFSLFFAITSNVLYAQVDITYQRLSLKVNPDTVFIEGESTICFRPTHVTNYIEIDLNDTFQIISFKYQNNEYPFTRLNHKIRVENESMFLSSRIDSIYIHYKGIPNNSFNSNSTNFLFHDTVPIFWTQSEPYGCADWWPTQNSLSDKIDSMDIIITCPSRYCSASNGILVSDSIHNFERISFWKHRYPIVPYLVGVAVTNYVMYYDTAYFENDTIPIMNFVFPEYEYEYRLNSFATAIMMHYFNVTYGEYPFKKEKYGHAQIPGYGGMENQTITFLSSYSYMLVAHELSHHWFGNYITCSSWSDVWLNEGFATYTSNLLLNYEPSPNGFDYWRWYCVNSITSEANGSVWVSDTSDRSIIFSGRLSYEKGGMLLHMIHYKIGDSLYFLTMKNYLNNPNFSYKFASTDDFKAVIEVTANIDLDNFFNYWFFGEGYPIFSIRAKNGVSNKLQIAINCQNSSLNNIPFQGELELLIKNSQFDTLVSVNMDESEKNLSFDLSFVPDSVIANPNHHLITPQTSVFINNEEKPSAVWIYPNPTADYVSFYCRETKIKHFIIYDNSGRLIFEESFDFPVKYYKMNVNLLIRGSYFVQFRSIGGLIFNNILIKI